MRGSLGVVVLALVLGPLAQAAHAGDAVDAGGAADAPVTSPDTIEVLGRTPIAPYYGEDLVNVLLNDSDPNGVSADCRDGVLHISVKRLEAALPRRIEIQ